MRKVYLLPNALTTGNLLCGVSAILLALRAAAHPELAPRFCGQGAWLILLGLLLDGLDGRVARLTRTKSAFGMNLDSLADLVTFGVAPVILLIQLGAVGPRISYSLAGLYASMAAIRLARFNVQTRKSNGHHFQGLPSPAPAAFLACLILVMNQLEITLPQLVLLTITVTLAVLMVTAVPYPSLKHLTLHIHTPYEYLVVMIIVLAAIIMAFDWLPVFLPPLGLGSLLLYFIWGPLQLVLHPDRKVVLEEDDVPECEEALD
jgi:CDP-diacylglycerol---serine O-phosphatidyltransferase